MIYGNADQTYDERQAVGINIGEELFIQWCARHNWHPDRIGFDEKVSNVSNFYRLNPIIRNLPDYVINRDDKTFVVNVKGTNAIKRIERIILPKMIDCFSSEEAPLIYAFCIRNQSVKFVKAQEVISLYDQEQDQQWNDGKIYRSIKLGRQT